MKQQCRICNSIFDYCHACAITKNPFKHSGYCGENCYRISMILQRYGSKLANATETVQNLKQYDIDNVSLQPKIEKIYQNIVNEVKPRRKTKIIEEVVPQEDVEVVVNTYEDMTISENE